MQTAWRSRSVRERQMILAGAAIVCGLLFYVGIYQPWQRSLIDLREDVRRDQEQVTWLRAAVAKVERLREAGRPVVSDSVGQNAVVQPSILTLIDRSAREGGLAAALRQVEPQDGGLFSVRFEMADFDSLLLWLSELGRRHGVEIVNAVIDVARGDSAMGVVDARLVLRAGST